MYPPSIQQLIERLPLESRSLFLKSLEHLWIHRDKQDELIDLWPIAPTCFDCESARLYRGTWATYDDPGDPPEAVCTKEEYRSLQVAYDHHAASHCIGFQPRRATRCAVCAKPMNAPLYNWPYQHDTGYNVETCCGSMCFNIWTDYYDLLIKNNYE